MKKLLIITLLTLSAVMSLTSCERVKTWQKNRTRIIEIHHRDSTFNIQKETITERYLQTDTTRAHFDLRDLMESGMLRSVDRYFTTEVRYIDSGILVQTTIDSLMERIRSLEKITGEISVKSEIDQKKKEKKKETEVSTTPWKIWILVIAFVILFFFAFRWVVKTFF